MGYSRHSLREEINTFVIEWFEDVSTYQGVVSPRVFVVSKFRQLILANVNHLGLFAGVSFLLMNFQPAYES